MRLTTVTAPTLKQAMSRIQQEYGDDAVVLSSKQILSPTGESLMEVSVGIDKDPSQGMQPQSQTATANSQADVMKMLASSYKKDAASNPTEPPLAEEQTTDLSALLNEHGVAAEFTQRIDKACSSLAETGFSTEDTLEMVLSKMVQFTPSGKLLGGRKILAFIGPTGAGKTTTLAKLAVEERKKGADIGLISLDHFKIGGAEQIKIYAEALGADYALCENINDVKDALERFDHKDRIFIDTMGINPFERSRFDYLKKVLGQTNAQVNLVLPCNLHAQELATLPRAFRELNPQMLTFSKMDETAHLGGIINAAISSELKVCYATDGQQVPDDILELDAPSLARKLLTKPKLPWEDF